MKRSSKLMVSGLRLFLLAVAIVPAFANLERTIVGNDAISETSALGDSLQLR